MASIPDKSRCVSPQATTSATARYTLSQLTPKQTAVCRHDSSLAQRDRNTLNAVVIGLLLAGSHHGTCSTFTPHVGQLPRRNAYSNATATPHTGTKSKLRSGSRSYPGPGS